MPEPLSRRRLLAVGGGLVVAGPALLGACGSDAPASGGGLSLFVVTPPPAAGGPQRLVLVARNAANEFVAPTKAVLRVGPGPDAATGATLPVEVRTDAAGAPPYLLVPAARLPAGTTWVHLSSAQGSARAPIEVSAGRSGVGPGDPLPSPQTPTAADAAGVDPICTRQPVCPLHEVTLAQALAEKRPLAVLVATPAFCQTAVCGPALDILLGELPAHRGVRALHLEVYQRRPSGPEISATPLAPAVKAFGLTSEPVLLTVKPDGTIADRLEGIVGAAELRAAFARLG